MKIKYIIAGLLFSTPVFSQMTGNDLFSFASEPLTGYHSNSPGVGAGVFMGYVAGVSNTARFMSEYQGQKGHSPSYCVPYEVTQGQLSDIVFNYLQEHVEIRQIDATILVVIAIGLKFPCPDSK
jgi:hypothetical protein